MSYKRYPIFDGDLTTAGGGCKVISPPKAVPMTYNGRHATFEGDKIWCEACKSHGAAKCIPPMRPNTSADGRQRVLSDDLCICKCPKPPRLVASINTFSIDFDTGEVTSLAGAGLWSQLDTKAEKLEFHDEQYLLMDESGNIMADMNYTINIKSTGATAHGVTDGVGMTQRIRTSSGGPTDIEIFWGNR